eukprot:484806-Pelagomonas_calceolata.AAC.3
MQTLGSILPLQPEQALGTRAGIVVCACYDLVLNYGEQPLIALSVLRKECFTNEAITYLISKGQPALTHEEVCHLSLNSVIKLSDHDALRKRSSPPIYLFPFSLSPIR